MSYIGIDYGKKRIGIAVSDKNGRIAFPRSVIANRGGASLQEIMHLLQKETISRIVVGLPVGLDGRETAQTEETRAFAAKLKEATGFPIAFENEMLTTRMAVAAGVKKEQVDASSAAIILQSYLDKQNGGKP